MLAEALAFNTSLFTLHEKSDILGRNAGYALSNEISQITGTMQNFDQYGRLNQVAVDGISGTFTYGYLEGSHLQKTLAMPNGVTRTFGYEPNRDLLAMIVHSNATERLVQRDFTFDGLGRLENRTLFRANATPVQPDAFAYNSRSELTNAIINANAFAYNFDPIGNRLEATEFGTNTSYVASALNQYTSITPVAPADNAFTPAFDFDGNQTLLKTTTGLWHVTYNAENRPILFSNDTTKVEMAYDYIGRRFEYLETVNNTLARHERYLYRGYLQIAALDMLDGASVKHTIAWDSTEPTATRPLSLKIGANAYFYSFDQVKNVTELFDSAGALAATYDYSPFGQITSALSVGSSAFSVASNPLTFSSEIHDSTLGLQYYNYRHLNLLDGRWVNRDPIEEEGGQNLYGFVENNSLNEIDMLGMWKILREGREYAIASVTSDSDTFDSLAKSIGLDTSDYKQWAHTDDKNPCGDYKIPNTIYYHHGVLKRFWETWPNNIIGAWRRQDIGRAASNRAGGFKVVIQEDVSYSVVKNALSDEYLYQYSFAGHGDGIGQLYMGEDLSVYAERYTKHGINLLVMHACYSAAKDGKAGTNGYHKYSKWEWNVATRGFFIGEAGEATFLNEMFHWRITKGINKK